MRKKKPVLQEYAQLRLVLDRRMRSTDRSWRPGKYINIVNTKRLLGSGSLSGKGRCLTVAISTMNRKGRNDEAGTLHWEGARFVSIMPDFLYFYFLLVRFFFPFFRRVLFPRHEKECEKGRWVGLQMAVTREDRPGVGVDCGCAWRGMMAGACR